MANAVDLTKGKTPTKASKVWFVTKNERGELFAFGHARRDAPLGKPLYDTVGGNMENEDVDSYARCAMREVDEEVALPAKWSNAMMKSIVLLPQGDALLQLVHADWEAPQLVAMWLVKLDWQVAHAEQQPVVTEQGMHEMVQGSMKWRRIQDVVSSLRGFVFMYPVAEVLDRM